MRRKRAGLRLGVCVLASALVWPGVVLIAGQAPQAKPAQGKPAQTKPPASPGRRGLPPESVAFKPRTGDFDEMVKRRAIRILTPYSKTHYFIDRGVPRGVVYDAGMLLEEYLNKQLKTTPATRVHVVFVPTSRDALYDSLVEGRGDVVAASVVVTPERQKLVDFTTPSRTDVNYVLVTGPGAPPVKTLDDLAGKQVGVRDRSLAFDDMTALSAKFKGEGKAPVTIKTVPMSMEDEDLLEMVSSGLLKAVVADQALADFWTQVLPGLTVHPNIVVRKGGSVAMAVRKGSPKLLAMLNPWVEANKQGTLVGNELLRRYLKSTKFAKNAISESESKKFRALVDTFQKYGDKYDLDYILMMAQGYQESQLDQKAKSHVGAIGVMQVMPATAKDLKVGDVRQIDSNIHAGVKYIRFMIDEFFKDEPMDRLNKGLFAFAAYNCGPGRVRQLRKEAQARGLNPNLWFNNVERIAGERVGRETVQYVSNIYKYYIAYTLSLEEWALPRPHS